MPNAGGASIIGSSAQLGTDVVLTGKIKDGEIINADINAAAAIDWTKISKVGSAIADFASKLITDLTGVLLVANGGTGKSSITAHKLIVGNGTSAATEITDATSGYVLTSNGASSDPSFQVLPAGIKYAVDAVGTDAYAITPTVPSGAYNVGDMYMFKAGTANTGNATLAVSGLAAINILKKGGTTLANNDILAGQMVLVAYNEVTNTIDTYNESNADGTYALSNTRWGLGQGFTGNGSKLTTVKFQLTKTLSPTGNMVAKIYTFSGSMGTTAIPSGAALATSANYDVSTVPGSPTIITFTFSGANQILLASATDYFVTVECTTNDNTNTIDVSYDASSPSHAKNGAQMNSSSVWSAEANKDFPFYVNGLRLQFDMLSQIAN